MECIVQDFIIFHLFSSVIRHGYTFTTVWNSKSEPVRAIKQQGLIRNQVIVAKLQIQKVKTEMSHWENSSFSKTTGENSGCKSTSFSSAQNTTRWELDSVDSIAPDSRCGTPCCALCGGEDISGLLRTQQGPHHPFDVLGNCSAQSLTQKSLSNDLKTLHINPIGDLLRYFLNDLLTSAFFPTDGTCPFSAAVSHGRLWGHPRQWDVGRVHAEGTEEGEHRAGWTFFPHYCSFQPSGRRILQTIHRQRPEPLFHESPAEASWKKYPKIFIKGGSPPLPFMKMYRIPCFPAPLWQTTHPTSKSGHRSSMLSWAPKGAKKLWTCCATSTTPPPTWVCAWSSTPQTGSLSTF